LEAPVLQPAFPQRRPFGGARRALADALGLAAIVGSVFAFAWLIQPAPQTSSFGPAPASFSAPAGDPIAALIHEGR
jgi:hypothetical protein